MNVTFNEGENVNGWTIKGKNGLSRFIAEKDDIIICFDTNAGYGINYSKILWYTDKRTNRIYRSMRYLFKFVSIVQGFSSQLYIKYKNENK